MRVAPTCRYPRRYYCTPISQGLVELTEALYITRLNTDVTNISVIMEQAIKLLGVVFCATVLIGRNKRLARPSVCPFVSLSVVLRRL